MRLLALVREWTDARAETWLAWSSILLGLLGLYLVGLDQGVALGAFLGDLALRSNWLHELFHDARHTAGFPCH